MISRDNIQWSLISNLSCEDFHHLKYAYINLGLEYESITVKTKDNSFGKQRNYYFIKDDEREFLSLDSLVEAYNEKFIYENETPDYKVEFVKIISKRHG